MLDYKFLFISNYDEASVRFNRWWTASVARILCCGVGLRTDQGAEGVERGGEWAGVSPSPADYGVWESVVSSPAGSGGPKTDFGAF